MRVGGWQVVAGAVALLVHGCVDRELPGWMIGVFSTAQPGSTYKAGFQ